MSKASLSLDTQGFQGPLSLQAKQGRDPWVPTCSCLPAAAMDIAQGDSSSPSGNEESCGCAWYFCLQEKTGFWWSLFQKRAKVQAYWTWILKEAVSLQVAIFYYNKILFF